MVLQEVDDCTLRMQRATPGIAAALDFNFKHPKRIRLGKVGQGSSPTLMMCVGGNNQARSTQRQGNQPVTSTNTFKWLLFDITINAIIIFLLFNI